MNTSFKRTRVQKFLRKVWRAIMRDEFEQRRLRRRNFQLWNDRNPPRSARAG